MQSYEEYLVSEFLQDRHPYLLPPFTSEIDPNQVTLAVFFRKVPKLAACLEYLELSDEKRADALHTLNEMVYHDQTKDIMISNEILNSCAPLLSVDDSKVRMETALLIGGLVIFSQARGRLAESGVFQAMQERLSDPVLKVRTAVAWALSRLSNSREGVELLVQTKTVSAMVSNFMKFTHKTNVSEALYMLLLLEGFINISEYDEGIQPMLGTKITEYLISFLKTSKTLAQFYTPLTERILHVLAHMALNHQGKNEATADRAIEAAAKFLKKENTVDQKKYASALIMSVTIALEGKHQAVALEKKSQPILIKRLFKRLLERNSDIWTNAKQSLINIADLPLGFQKACTILSYDITILDEIYAYNAVKPLASLLPKFNTYMNPPRIPEEGLIAYQRYISALAFLVEKYSEAVIQAIDTVNILEKVCPFVQLYTGVSKEAITIVRKICDHDEHNRAITKRMATRYEEIGREIRKVRHLAELLT